MASPMLLVTYFKRSIIIRLTSQIELKKKAIVTLDSIKLLYAFGIVTIFLIMIFEKIYKTHW